MVAFPGQDVMIGDDLWRVLWRDTFEGRPTDSYWCQALGDDGEPVGETRCVSAAVIREADAA
jgi:hypothetical protein